MPQEIPVDVVARFGDDDNEPGAAAHHGDGKYIARDGSDVAYDFAWRLVVALHGRESGNDTQREPSD